LAGPRRCLDERTGSAGAEIAADLPAAASRVGPPAGGRCRLRGSVGPTIRPAPRKSSIRGFEKSSWRMPRAVLLVLIRESARRSPLDSTSGGRCHKDTIGKPSKRTQGPRRPEIARTNPRPGHTKIARTNPRPGQREIGRTNPRPAQPEFARTNPRPWWPTGTSLNACRPNAGREARAVSRNSRNQPTKKARRKREGMKCQPLVDLAVTSPDFLDNPRSQIALYQ
jgi:hypothetical protein